MAAKSAGLLFYRYRGDRPEVLLVHPGGPYWAKKDEGAWSIPKGEYDEGEDPLTVARREFREETGHAAEEVLKRGEFQELGELRQPGGKRVTAWAAEGDLDARAVRSNTFRMEWPPRSGKQAEFPEVDRAGWFSLETARRKILTGQIGFIDQLRALLT